MIGTAGTAPSRTVWVALWVVYLVWGSTYLAIRVVVEGGLPPLISMGTRFLAAGLLMSAFVAVRRGPRVFRLTAGEVRAALTVGVLLLLLGNGMVAIAEQTVPSGLAALLVGAVPLWMVLLRILAGHRPGRATLAGVLVGFAGIAVISLPRGGIEGVQAWGVLMVVAAALAWSIGSFVSPTLGLPADPLVATAAEMVFGGAVMFSAGLLRGEARELQLAEAPGTAWVALAYLGIVGSLLAYTAYVWLLGHAPLSLVSTYAYVNPVVAVLLGAIVLREPISGVIAAGGALTVLGVLLVVRGERARGKGSIAREGPSVGQSQRGQPSGEPGTGKRPPDDPGPPPLPPARPATAQRR